jgi:hypothetical protein
VYGDEYDAILFGLVKNRKNVVDFFSNQEVDEELGTIKKLHDKEAHSCNTRFVCFDLVVHVTVR